MFRYCVVILLAACTSAIPGSYKHGLIGHRPHSVLPINQGPGLQNNLIWNGINGGRQFTASGGQVSKSLTHHGKSIHVNDGRSTATATAHHDGTFSANVVPNQLLGSVHPGAVRSLGPVGSLGSVGSLGRVGPFGHSGFHGSVRPYYHSGLVGRHFSGFNGGLVHPGRRNRVGVFKPIVYFLFQLYIYIYIYNTNVLDQFDISFYLQKTY
jgi:hypothetical protein